MRRSMRGRLLTCKSCESRNCLVIVSNGMNTCKCAECTVQDLVEQNDIFSLWLQNCSAYFVPLHDLKEYVERIPHDDYSRLLFFACRMGRKDIVEFLLQNSVDTNSAVAGRYPIIEASSRNDEAIVKLLLDHGAEPNVKDDEGNTATIAAASFGGVEVIRLLLKAGANLDAKNVQGGSAFLAACTMGKAHIVNELLSLGVDPLTKNDQEQNGLMLASLYGHKSMIQLLLKRTALDIQARDIHLDTALIFAAQKSKQITKILLAHGALVSCKNKFNGTAIGLTFSEEITKLLRLSQNLV